MRNVIKALKEKNLHIAVTESCTGGLISKMITDISGSSAVFECGITAYSNRIKHEILGVKEETLAQYGAVSEETAREMALGVLKLSGADIAVSVTGIAGPHNDGSQKPVGTVCISVATADKLRSATFMFMGSRIQIRRKSAKQAIDMLCEEAGIEKPKTKSTKKEFKAVKKTKKALDKLIKR